MATLRERFWSKVDIRGPDECWEWTASCVCGYGQIYAGVGRPLRAHRVAWELSIGPIPQGKHLLHSCDNPKCVNVRHLTHADNMADMSARGRAAGARGEKSPRAKLTRGDVREIRALRGKVKQADLAKRFGVKPPAITRIQLRQRWGWLD